MTKEEKVGLLLEVYEQEKQRLNKEFNEKLSRIIFSPNEPDQKNYNELYAWRDKEKAAIEHRFKRAILAMEG